MADEPGSVPSTGAEGVRHLSTMLIAEAPLSFYPPAQLHAAAFGRATLLTRWFTRTFIFRCAQHDCRQPPGELLPHLLTLTSHGTVPTR